MYVFFLFLLKLNHLTQRPESDRVLFTFFFTLKFSDQFLLGMTNTGARGEGDGNRSTIEQTRQVVAIFGYEMDRNTSRFNFLVFQSCAPSIVLN